VRPLEGRDSEPEGASRKRVGPALVHSFLLSISCLITYWLLTHILVHAHSLSRADSLLGGLWAVLATIFVYRTSHEQSVTAAASRGAATSLSFALCLMLILPFHAWGLALLIGIGTLVMMLAGRSADVVTTAITTAGRDGLGRGQPPACLGAADPAAL
jgi:peptidoglycan/LPS O-acetylase OafA/YrhL